MKLLFAILLTGMSMYGQIAGKPTNLDEHGMRMRQSNVDGATRKLAHPNLAGKVVEAISETANILVWTRGYDNTRAGANLAETTLTPANVSGLHKLYSHVMPGDDRGIEAQPLIIPQVTLRNGDIYDIALYATMANDVFAFDANSSQLLWEGNFGKPITGSTEIDGWLINDHWGILSTPVYDKDTGIVYFVTWTSPDNNWRDAIHTLHAVSVATGQQINELSLEGVTYSPGSGLPAVSFSGSERKQRASLALASVGGKKTVFIPFGTITETSASARGWMIAYDVASNSVGAAWTSTARYAGGGIWAAGQAPAVRSNTDGTADLYFLTGNGSFDALTDWGESFIRLHYTPPASSAAGNFAVGDWWSPWSDSARAGGPASGTHITVDNGGGWDDMDLGSSSVVDIPALNLLVGSGKDGIAYVLNAANLGKTQPNDFLNPTDNYAKAKWIGWLSYYNPATPAPQNATALNTLYANRTHHVHSTPVWFQDANGYKLYVWGENGNLRAWSISAAGVLGYLGCGAEVASANSPVPPGGMPGGMLSISANGKQNGLIIATVPLGDANKEVTQGNVMIYSASTFGKYSDGSGSMPLLWKSPTYTYNKFDPPIVSGGKVFVPTYSGSVDIYGL